MNRPTNGRLDAGPPGGTVTSETAGFRALE